RLRPPHHRLGAGPVRRQPDALRLDARAARLRHHPALRRPLADPRVEPPLRRDAGLLRVLPARHPSTRAAADRVGAAGDARLRGHARGAAGGAFRVDPAGLGHGAQPGLPGSGGGDRRVGAAYRARARAAPEDPLSRAAQAERAAWPLLGCVSDVTRLCGGTDSTSHTLPPITEWAPITVSPPRMVAPA